MPEQQQTAELEGDIGGQKFKYNGPINTLATIATLFVVGLIAYGGFMHMQDTRIASAELVAALKEQTQTMRESNCLQTYRGPDEQKQVFCKQVTR